MGPRTFGYNEFDAVNAELIAKGLPPVQQDPKYSYDVDELVDRLADTDPQLEKLSTSRWARAVGAEILEQHLDWGRSVRDLFPYRPNARSAEAYEHYYSGPWDNGQLDDYITQFADPDRANSVGFWVYTDNRRTKAGSRVPLQQPTPIEHLGQYRRVVETRLDPFVKGCQLNVSVFCLQSRRVELFAVKRGESICVARCCRRCLELFDLPEPLQYAARAVGPQCTYGSHGASAQYPEPTITRTHDRNSKGAG